MINWDIYLHSRPTMKVNKYQIPVNNFAFNEEGIAQFNEIYQYFLNLEQEGVYKRFVATPSGGISIKRENIRGLRWSFTKGKAFSEIVVKHPETACFYRFIIGMCKQNGEEKSITGRKAFTKLTNELVKDNVILDNYSITNGEDVKKTFPKINIKCCGVPNRTYNNCHHIDLNSAFAAGMMKEFPALEPTFRRIYNKRKEDPINKAILNMSYGFMQSSLVNYRYAHISKAGIDFTNNYLDKLTANLKDKGYRILGYNTDGIWYQGSEPYHDEDEGTDIGQWKNDHTYCKLRYKSDGVYEFIEDDVYHPVFRGTSDYEKIKPREEWVWGDIFNSTIIKYVFIEGYGFKELIYDVTC